MTNIGYKITALLISLILWFILLGQKEMVLNKEVTVMFQASAGRTIDKNHPHKIKVKLSGTYWSVQGWEDQQKDFLIPIHFREPGNHQIILKSEDFSVPPGVKLLSWSPRAISVDLLNGRSE